jgi:hypothetical protein
VGRQGDLSYSFFESLKKNKVRQTGRSKVSVVTTGWVELGLAPLKCGSGVETRGIARVVLSFILDSRTTTATTTTTKTTTTTTTITTVTVTSTATATATATATTTATALETIATTATPTTSTSTATTTTTTCPMHLVTVQ